MRIKFVFDLIKKEIPLDYRRIFISFFKNALENYDKEIKEKYYKNQDVIHKPFTFAVYFENPVFRRDFIELENNSLNLNFSTACLETGIDYYNAIVKMINKPYPLAQENFLILKNIVMVNEPKLVSNEIVIKTMSPLLVRKHHKSSNHDVYLKPEDEDYVAVIKNNLDDTLEKLGLGELKEDLDSFNLEEIMSKEVKVLFYGHKVGGRVGKFLLKGQPRLLDFVLKNGLGARTNAGFGMLEVG